MRVCGPRLLTTERTHINDATVRAAQRRDAALRNQEWRADIDSKDFIPLFGGDCFNICGFKETSVVNEYVNLMKMLQYVFDRVFSIFWPAKITFERKRLNTRS